MDLSYPAGPATVPDSLTKPTRAYKHKAWLAMAGLAAFVTLYLFLAGWFLFTAYRMLSGALAGGKGALVGGLIGLCAGFLAVFMLKALFFIKHGSKSDDIEITPAQQPRLFQFLHRLADEAGAPRPHRVYLSPRVNAAVFYDLSILNFFFPSRKNLEIGLALVNVLTLGELKAVCAHEFGHFAQRSMAVGRWVYMAQQIAAHIVAKRDALDKLLRGLSNVDIRIAWIGWILTLIVWSIRSLMETAFRVVVLAQRALSREMEMQADLVAVSLTGSDSLIHALHRLQAADEAWERAVNFARGELAKGRAVQDVFAIQTRIIERTGSILNKPDYGQAPPLPAQQPAVHRVFKAELAQPPRMWATHPLNHEREDNAKRVYIPAPLDDRSAWDLFDNAQALREQVSATAIGAGPDAVVEPAEAAIKTLDEQYHRESLSRAYRGAYLWRSVVRSAERAADLYESLPDPALAGTLASLYPESLAGELEQLHGLEREKSMLEALRDGVFTAPNGIIRHRGKALQRRELPHAIDQLRDEIAAVQARVNQHDRRVRSAHRAAAAGLGGGWEAYLVGLARTLHYADHSEADLRDVRAVLGNVVTVETAGGRVSSGGVKRVLKAANDVQQALDRVFAHSEQVVPDASLLQRMGVAGWQEALGTFKLVPPTKENINDWLNALDSWIDQAADALAALRTAALDQLLTSEAEVARHHRQGSAAPAASAPSRVPADYPTLVPGAERKLQTRLGWWARFQTADGLVPEIARLVVAGAIVGAVLGLGGSVGDATVTVYNGLGRAVQVNIGASAVDVAPFATAVIQVKPDRSYPVVARTAEGQVIESFDADVHGSFASNVYNIAASGPLVEWTAVYGNAQARPERQLGAPRWITANADVMFAEPPSQVQTKGGGATRSVLQGYSQEMPNQVLGLIAGETEQARVIATRARWDGPKSRHVMHWLALAQRRPEFPAILAARLKDNPREILTLRMEQDTAAVGEHAAVCERHRALALAAPTDGDLQYLVARCLDAGPAQTQAYLDGHRDWPRSGWWAYAAGYVLAGQAQWPEALASLDLARRVEPETALPVALDMARIRRLVAGNGRVNLADLARSSDSLDIMLTMETGKGLDGSPIKAYSVLAQGHIDQALQLVKQAPAVRSRLIRLAAASDDANPALAGQVLAMPLDQGIDDDTLLTTAALAARSKRPLAAYADPLKQLVGDDAVTLLRFLELAAKGDTGGAEQLLHGLRPYLRGQAYSMGSVVLGTKAPAAWRMRAKTLLFASERPYFI